LSVIFSAYYLTILYNEIFNFKHRVKLRRS